MTALSLIGDSWETYLDNLKLVLLFSIPFLIAFAIPLLAPLPTYITGGAIFLRTASIFLNIDVLGLAVIVVSLFLSLLFLSFAFVAISLIVKSKRTFTKHTGSVMRGVERYTARVFALLLAYAVALILINVFSYAAGLEQVITPIAGFFIFMLIFYAPTAIVMDDRPIGDAISQSASMVFREPWYFLLWFVLIFITVSAVDFLAIAFTGTIASRYVLLVVNSLIILPYFVIFQAEAYMRRFTILKH